jgi:hypothetical protein
MSAASSAVAARVVPLAPVAYRWDADTGILAVRVQRPFPEGPASQIVLAGRDGAWIVLELHGGALSAVDVVVWPAIREVPRLVPPVTEPVPVTWPAASGVSAVRALSVPLVADVGDEGRVVRLRMAGRPVARTVRVANGLCVDLDRAGQFAGLWLLDVPPCPEGS